MGLTVPAPPDVVGVASQYGQGVFERGPLYTRTHGLATPAIRENHAVFDGYAAARYPAQIDQVWRVCPEDDKLPCRKLLVVDCAGVTDGTLGWMLRNDILMEVDHGTAVAWDTVGYGIRVRVYPQMQRSYPRHAFD
jgi:hypothetical protein